MRKHKNTNTDRELWPDGLPYGNFTAPLISLPLADRTTFTFVKAASNLTKRIDIQTKSTLP
jgi:hypothetical protein